MKNKTLLFIAFTTLLFSINAQTVIFEDIFNSYASGDNILTSCYKLAISPNFEEIAATGLEGTNCVLVSPAVENTVFYKTVTLEVGKSDIFKASAISPDVNNSGTVTLFAEAVQSESNSWGTGFWSGTWASGTETSQIVIEPVGGETQWRIGTYYWKPKPYLTDNCKLTEGVGVENPATIPVAYDFTNPANDWLKPLVDDVDTRLNAIADPANIKVVFVGNSITHGWLTAGESLWNKYFAKDTCSYYAANIAVPGDRTENILYRLIPTSDGGEYGHLDNVLIDPEVIVLMIGTNNYFVHTAEQTIGGISAVIDTLQSLRPNAHIILCSVLPNSISSYNAKIMLINTGAKQLADSDEKITWLDLYSKFINQDGMQIADLFKDGVHPNFYGYQQWYNALEPILKRLFPTTTELQRFSENTYVSPNPCTGYFSIIGNEELSSYSIYDSTGVLVTSVTNIGLDTIGIDLLKTPKGVYFINIKSVNGSFCVKKIIIE
jgi:beta-glucosidase